MKKYLIVLLALTLAVSMVFMGIGCKPEAPAEEAAEEEAPAEEAAPAEEEAESMVIDELTIVQQIMSSSDDVQVEFHYGGIRMMRMVYNGLVEWNQDYSEITPTLAEKWEISEDGLEYTFYLREGVKFHNGREMVAEDVKFTMERWVMPELATTTSSFLLLIDKVEVIDDYTVKLILAEPNVNFLAGIAFRNRAIVAKESYDPDDITKVVEAIGTGPYKMVDYVINEQMILEAFEDYWAGAPNVKKLIMKIIPDDAVRMTSLKTGEADIIIDVVADEVALLEESGTGDEQYTFMVKNESIRDTWGFTLQWNSEPLKDVRVRKAIGLALDPQLFIDLANGGIGIPATSYWPPWSFWHTEIDIARPDMDEAKRLLSEAEKDGWDPESEIEIMAAPEWGDIGEIAQQQLLELGLNVKMDVREIGPVWQSIFDGDFDIYTNTIDFWPPGILNGQDFWVGPDSYWSGGIGADPEIMELVKKASLTLDPNEQKEYYDQINRLHWEKGGQVWVYHIPHIIGYNKALKGIDIDATGMFNYENNKGIPWATLVE